ncbi:MAG: hypothetical protein IJY57_04205 [Clostridia bacterium]|nr:hypothetical protein [Clostridia bacterium]
MKKLKDTPARLSRRKYEEVHKKERKEQNKVWGTSIPRYIAEKIDAFLLETHMSKVDLILLGHMYLKETIKLLDSKDEKVYENDLVKVFKEYFAFV